jgi:predicted nucleic-acid-binding protein
VRAADTNILARFILRDDEAQLAQAMLVMREPVWITMSVLLELGWVLGKRLAMDRAVVAEALVTILSLETVTTSDTPGLLWAAQRFREGADWADMVHLVSSKGGVQSFVTFDRRLFRSAGSDAPVPVVTFR